MVADMVTTIRMINPSLPQLRLWQLISPALPVGSYAYSGGLESAVENGWLVNQPQAKEWIEALLVHGMAHLDVPVFSRLYQACVNNDQSQFQYWNDYLLASRESAELVQEDQQLGRALLRLLRDLGLSMPWCVKDEALSYASMFASAAVNWQIAETDAAQGLLWAWCENQVAAAIKLVPLGQTAGQKILSELIECIPICVEQGLQLSDDDIGFTLVGLGMVSAQHETQYSRLFRS